MCWEISDQMSDIKYERPESRDPIFYVRGFKVGDKMWKIKGNSSEIICQSRESNVTDQR